MDVLLNLERSYRLGWIGGLVNVSRHGATYPERSWGAFVPFPESERVERRKSEGALKLEVIDMPDLAFATCSAPATRGEQGEHSMHVAC